MSRHVFTLIVVLGLCGLAQAIYLRQRAPAGRPDGGSRMGQRSARAAPRAAGRDESVAESIRPRGQVSDIVRGKMSGAPGTDRTRSANPPARFDGLTRRADAPTPPAIATARPPAVVWPPSRSPSAASPAIASANGSQAARPSGVAGPATSSGGERRPMSPSAPASASPLDDGGPLLASPANLPPDKPSAAGWLTGSLCGSWQDRTRSIRLDTYGRIVVEEDGPAASPRGDSPSGPIEHRVLSGWYHVDEHALQVSWDDGPRTTYRWQLQDGRLWLTSSDDCHFILSKSHSTTVQR